MSQITTTPKSLAKLLEKSNYADNSFTEDFNEIIAHKIQGYDGKTKDKLKSFLEDMRHGCSSGMIGDFIYNADCKDFYIKHIDDLESMKDDMEDQMGEPITDRMKLPHYTFLCWLCFEEYCYDLDRTIFDS